MNHEYGKILIAPIMYLNCAFEISLLYIFLNGLFQLDEERKWIRVLETLVCTTVLFGINSFNLPNVNLICVPIIFFVYVQMIFRLKLKYAFLYVIYYFAITAGTEFVAAYFYEFFGINVSVADFGRLFILVIQDMLRFAIVQFIIRQHQVPYGDNSYRYLRSLFLLPITTIILLNGCLVLSVRHIVGTLLISIGGILLIVSNMSNFITVEILLKALSEANELQMMEMKSHLERQHYQRLEEANRDKAEYIHETSRILRTMEQLALGSNGAVVKDLLGKLPQKKMPALKVYCENIIMDAILTERDKQAAEKGVIFTISIQQGMNFDFIDDIDKISMFGNLLDNALEAAAESENGYVNINIFEGNEALTICKVENNFTQKPERFGKEYLTIKKRKKEHGFGLKLVKDLSEKYGGKFDTIVKENTFTAILILSNLSISEI